MARHRVSLGRSVRFASNAGIDSTNPDMVAPQSTLLAPLIFGFWWWIVGVPESEFNRDNSLDDAPPTPTRPMTTNASPSDNNSGMVIHCAECDCAVESGVRVTPCDRVDCCCDHSQLLR